MQSSHLPPSIASRKPLEPLELVRSPIIRNDASCSNGTAWYSDARPGSGRGLRRAGSASWTALTTWAMCSGVEPQQPPTMRVPNSATNPASACANSSGPSGYTAPRGPRIGRPALGITDTNVSACLDR